MGVLTELVKTGNLISINKKNGVNVDSIHSDFAAWENRYVVSAGGNRDLLVHFEENAILGDYGYDWRSFNIPLANAGTFSEPAESLKKAILPFSVNVVREEPTEVLDSGRSR